MGKFKEKSIDEMNKPLKKGEFIVKVQQSLATNGESSQMLIYNEDKSILFEDDLDESVKIILKGCHKAYFKARLNEGMIKIGEEIPNQSW